MSSAPASGRTESAGYATELADTVPERTSPAPEPVIPASRQGGYLAICAIMKNEAIGVREWIAYHHALGVEKFFLYDHGSEDDTVAMVQPLVNAGIVELTPWPHRPGQIQAYDDFASRHKGEWTWCAFIDLDEFINPFGHEDIPTWLHGFDDRSGVAIQWVNFGPNNHDEPPKGLTIEAYRTRLPDIHPMHGHVKTFVRMAKYDHAHNPHSFFVTDGEIVDELDRPVMRQGVEYAIQMPMLHDNICLNHYYTRSRREWWIKINRGLADAGNNPVMSRDPEWLQVYERESLFRDDRITKFVSATKAALEKMDHVVS